MFKSCSAVHAAIILSVKVNPHKYLKDQAFIGNRQTHKHTKFKIVYLKQCCM